MSKPWCSKTGDGLRLAVQISPNAKRTEVIGEAEAVLKIKLQAPPVDGKANDALVRYLADRLDVPKSAVTITHGLSSKKKLIEVRGASLTVDATIGLLLPT